MTSQPTSSLLTSEQQGRISGILALGGDVQTAVRMVGCSLSDLRRQMEQDAAFLKKVLRAEASVELGQIRNVLETAKEKQDWRASVWWLERRSPERFARRNAGVVTLQQLKGFVAILTDAVADGIGSSEDRAAVLARLQSIAESAEQMIRDAQLDSTDPSNAALAGSDTAAEGDAPGAAVQRLFNFDNSD